MKFLQKKFWIYVAVKINVELTSIPIITSNIDTKSEKGQIPQKSYVREVWYV